MTPASEIAYPAFARGLEPDPDMSIDEWADQYMIIPKESGAAEHGKYRTSRTPHARMVMQVLSDHHPCKRVVVKGASQMLKTQVGLNFFAASVHQSPSNFLWITPTGKLAKRASMRIAKTIEAVDELKERVAQARSRDAVNNMDTKEYIGGSLTIATAGAAANLSEISVRRLVYDEIDRSEENIQGEGAGWKLAEGRQTSFDRTRKAYYPSSPTIEDESAIDDLFKMGTQRVALADCIHCGHAQPLEFERLKFSEDGQYAVYQCPACFKHMVESDKAKMFERGAWSEGVEGDGETESFTISALFLPYGWFSWLGLLKEYKAAKAKLDEGSDELMIVFYNTRLARCWARQKEQTKYADLMDRAEPYRLGTVPANGLILTAAVDTQNDRLEMKVVAWGYGMENWIVDFQIVWGSPSDKSTWKSLDVLLSGRYRHAHGEMLPISATFIDSGGAHTQEVYDYTLGTKRRNIFAIKGDSRPKRPIISAKPSAAHINTRGKVEKKAGHLWYCGTDTAKDYLAARFPKSTGPGATHFSQDLPENYYKQLTAEYRKSGYKRGRKVSWWECKNGDRNEALDLMVYNLAAAYHLGLHRKTDDQWALLRQKVNPPIKDMLNLLDLEDAGMLNPAQGQGANEVQTSAQTTDQRPDTTPPKNTRVSGGKITAAALRRP